MMRGQRFLKEELVMVKELNYYNIERDDVTIFSNGVVLREI